MNKNEIHILSGVNIRDIIKNKENSILSIIEEAYSYHYKGKTNLPQSVFLRFPKQEKNRIIALPGYIDGEKAIAGIKWISSFPDNIYNGIDRASALVVLNDMENGRPKAVLEGSLISANRTAASAALAAKYLHKNDKEETLGMIGTGVINFTILKYLNVCFTTLKTICLYDLDASRCNAFRKKIEAMYLDKFDIKICSTYEELLQKTNLISFATTSAKPYIDKPELFHGGMTVLHVSLRDLSENVILQANNIADDIDHVDRAETSIHLTTKKVGNRDFINGVLAECFEEKDLKLDSNKATIFSPFGLEVLDLALSQFIYDEAEDLLSIIDDFFV